MDHDGDFNNQGQISQANTKPWSRDAAVTPV
jgi:hypothetical protein